MVVDRATVLSHNAHQKPIPTPKSIVQRAPHLRPNTVPRSCWPYFDDPTLASWAPASEAQRTALAAALAAERRKALGGEGKGETGVRLALVAEMDADGGVCHIQGAKVRRG